MSDVNVVTEAPRHIPQIIRRVAYWTLFVAGIVVASCNILDVETLFSVTMDKWQELITYYGTVMGFIAGANVVNTKRRSRLL